MSRSPSRRRQRGVRVLVAMGLLLAATGTAVVALASGSVASLVVATAAGPVLGWAALRITRNELRDERRLHAQDRAAQAAAYEALFAVRSEEHRAFLGAMTERLEAGERRVERLQSQLRAVEARARASDARARRALKRGEQARLRVSELEAALATRDEDEAGRPASWPVSA